MISEQDAAEIGGKSQEKSPYFEGKGGKSLEDGSSIPIQKFSDFS